MPDENSLDPQSGANSTPSAEPAAEAPKSFREIAEAAYDEAAGTPEPTEQPEHIRVDDAGRVRDASGRFVAKPGEQSTDPAPTTEIPASPEPQKPPTQPQPGEAVEAPQNWSAEDRAIFLKQQPEAQAFLLRRHKEMEADYTAKTQQASTAVNFVQSLTPIFTDPVIAGSLQQEGVAPAEAIRQWAAYHRAAMSPNMADRVKVLQVMAQRMQVDPAAAFPQSGSQPVPGLTEADMKDPAIRFFAERDVKRANEVAELRQNIQRMNEATQTERQQAALQASRWSVDSFAEETGSDGKPLHPHFDRVLPQLLTLYRADRTLDLKVAYPIACRMNAEVHAEMIAAERSAVERKFSTQRASAAVRGNARGLTTPVKGPPANANGKTESFREVAERVADELGFE